MPLQPQEPSSNNHNIMQEETLVETGAYQLDAHVKTEGWACFHLQRWNREKRPVRIKLYYYK